MFFGGIGLVMLLGFLSLFIKLSFSTWAIIWVVLMVIFAFVEEAQKQEQADAKNNKKCLACAESILLEAKKCKHCGEMQS